MWDPGMRPDPRDWIDPRPANALQQRDRIAHSDRACGLDGAVERHRAAELPDDPAEHGGILDLRIRIVRGHHAPCPELGDGNHHLADPEPPTRPLTLAEPVDASDHDVLTETPAVDPERSDRAIRRDQQRENVEPLLPDEALESRRPAERVGDPGCRLG